MKFKIYNKVESNDFNELEFIILCIINWLYREVFFMKNIVKKLVRVMIFKLLIWISNMIIVSFVGVKVVDILIGISFVIYMVLVEVNSVLIYDNVILFIV